MIPRYTPPEMAAIWNEEAKYQSWLDVEIYACETWAKKGVIPKSAVKEIKKNATVNVERIEEIEAQTRHDIVAFTRQLAETIGPASKWVHYGLTSNDVVDTAQGIRLSKAMALVLKKLEGIINALKSMALEHKMTPCMGRTHGIHAEPTTFGLKALLWYEEMKRNRERLKKAREMVRVGKISGAVGTYSQVTPEIEADICKRAGLKVASVSTQVLQRDRHAELLSSLAIMGSTIEKIAVEIRHLQRTEVLEAEEGFAKGQTGSSAMPHKRNPIGSENLTGLARLLRGNAATAFENNALWHERDISHSSAERVILPDSTIAAHYMLGRMTNILNNLNVYPKNMKKNLELTRGLIFSQHILIALIEKGLLREDAYKVVQRCAMKTWKGKKTLKQNLLADAVAKKYLKSRDIDSIMQVERYLKHVDAVYKRCGL